jgi:hypothetical protein
MFLDSLASIGFDTDARSIGFKGDRREREK